MGFHNGPKILHEWSNGAHHLWCVQAGLPPPPLPPLPTIAPPIAPLKLSKPTLRTLKWPWAGQNTVDALASDAVTTTTPTTVSWLELGKKRWVPEYHWISEYLSNWTILRSFVYILRDLIFVRSYAKNSRLAIEALKVSIKMKGAGTQLMLQLMETPSACHVFPFKSGVVVVAGSQP